MAHTDQPDAPMGSTSTRPRDDAPAAGVGTRACAVGPERRAYCVPVLRHLGSVRELTLGGTGPLSEGGGTRKPIM
jgi:hypothetical protein